MTTFPTKSVRRIGLRALLVAPLLLLGQNCTKLTEVPHDALTPDNAFHTDAELLGGVPLATTTELKQYPRSARTDVFAFIDKELTESIPNLPDKWPSSFYGRVTKGAANAILASLYLNAGVFNKNTGVDAAGYNSCTIAISGGRTGCQAAITAADAVINSGTYTLNTDWYQNFSATNKSSPENIFV